MSLSHLFVRDKQMHLVFPMTLLPARPMNKVLSERASVETKGFRCVWELVSALGP